MFAQTTATTTRTSTSSLAVGETVQVNITNIATASSSGTPASCPVSVAFYNTSGAIIGTATAATLTSGQIATVKLPYASAGAAGLRTVVRAVVSHTATYPSPPPCSLEFSLETFDTATGVTHVHNAGGAMQGGSGH